MNVPIGSLPGLDSAPSLEQDPALNLSELVDDIVGGDEGDDLIGDVVQGEEQEVSEPGQEAVEPVVEEKVRFTYEGKEYEATPQQIIEFYNGYMRKEEFTKRVQYLNDHQKKQEGDLTALHELNRFMQYNPDKGRVIYDLMFGDGSIVKEYVQKQYPNATPQQVDKTVAELLDQSGNTNGATNAPAEDPRIQQLQHQLQQVGQFLYQQEQQKVQYAAQQYEAQKLDYRLNQARQKYGDSFNEKNVLEWMLYLKTDDPEIAIGKMYLEALNQQRSKPQMQVAQQRTATQQVPVVETGKLGGARGVAANARPLNKPGSKPKKNMSLEQVGLKMLQDFGA